MDVVAPPTVVASLQGDRGVLTVSEHAVVWQSRSTARRWHRSDLRVAVTDTALTLSSAEGECSFQVESGNVATIFGVTSEGSVDDGMGASTVASAVRTPSQRSEEVPPSFVLVFADRTIALTESDYVVGRDPVPGSGQISIAVDDQTVSRNHASISVDADRLVVTDLGSSNGTFIHPEGGAEISVRPNSSVLVTPGTRVGFGDLWCLLQRS